MNAAAGEGCFVDTNLLLYSFDPADPVKHALARQWLAILWSNGAGRISWQVLNEFCANAERKLKVPSATVRESVESLVQWQPLGFHVGAVRRTWYWMDQAGLNYWDGMILAAAESLGCPWLLSEDFQPGRKYGTVQVVDPFQTDPRNFFRGEVFSGARYSNPGTPFTRRESARE